MSQSRHPRSHDPFHANVALEQRTTLPVLGYPVTFESNDPAVIAIAEESFGLWRVIEQAPRLIEETAVLYRAQVEAGEEGGAAHPRLFYHSPDAMRVILRTPGSVGVADAARHEIVLYTTRTLLAHRQHFRYGVLEALTLAVLTRLDRQPLHAACITRGETALLLSGRSGSGKSTLAYAASRAGYKVLSEDYVNIQMEPRLRVWGMPGYLHLPVDAARHFPELKDARASLMANGKQKIALNLAELGATPPLPVAQRAGICVLDRGDEYEPSLETLDPAALHQAMTTDLDPGFDVFARSIGECIHLLASHGGWRLRVGSDPAQALPHIARMFDVLTGG
jgi:hypothetical protein